ncbi:universal stress protein [Christiangramia sediminis]|uniref:Universal stress protein n=1 Tax=Christiangramia sediminis TaxID=2881336 RepID=A0A9X1RY88_9FLAO|nr:universal stress protein [Christiangramia sediminis]MCB7481040.1 universal stress protein [Christiangramia sediminis]
MKNILLATDFSKNAYCALHYITNLLREEECRFFIANFYGENINQRMYSRIGEEKNKKIEALRIEAEEAALELKHQIIRDSPFKKHHFQTIVSQNKLIEGVKNLIAEKNIMLMVMGARGISNLKTRLFGTSTTKVVESSLSIPLLVVPREVNYKIPKKIAFASELILPFYDNSLDLLVNIASTYKSKIILVHIGEEDSLLSQQRENLNKFQNLMPKKEITKIWLSQEGSLSKTIADYVKRYQIDLLTMIYYKHNFLDKLFRENIMMKIDLHSSFPLLILPAFPRLIPKQES